MGCDIHIQAQKRDASGAWQEVRGSFSEGPSPFDWRSYGMFAFLAGVRNYGAIAPIAEPRGLPDDVRDEEPFGDHSYSWLSVEELCAVDYDAVIEDLRVMRQVGSNLWSGACTAGPGEGEKMPLREYLGDGFMHDLVELQRIGAERIVFGFDS